MLHQIFPTPLWVKNVNTKKLKLISTNFKKNWLSDTLSSYGGDNQISRTGYEYLKSKILDCLKDINIKDCKITDIWRNIYDNDFQEKHMHSNSNFSFTIYEKLQKPQTVFIHPAHDLIYATNVNNFLKHYYIPDVKENEMVLFPSYLSHMVKRSHNSITISGNIDII